MRDKQPPRYAARLNSFKVGAEPYWPGKNRVTTADLLERAATVDGLNAADLNYPDHFENTGPRELAAVLDRLGIGLNGLAMRYYSDPDFRLGALTNPDPARRRKAIDLTRRGLDALAEMGGTLMTFWLGQDGFVLPDGAGTLVMQNEVPEAVNRAVAAGARKSGATVVLNAAPMRPLAPETMRLVDLLIVNRIEAEALFAVPILGVRDALEAAKRARDGFDGETVITLGSDGLVHRDRRGNVRHHAARCVPVVSAHGAGDVFVGALSARLAASAAMEDAIAYAQSAAARFVSTPIGDRGILCVREGSTAHAE